MGLGGGCSFSKPPSMSTNTIKEKKTSGLTFVDGCRQGKHVTAALNAWCGAVM